MPTLRFLIIDYRHSWVEDSLFVWCATDVPSHLYLRWTDKRDWMHLHALDTRGDRLMKDPKYCFVEWLEVEQNEAGDTMVHTFNFPSWGT
ncbi:hypothetical protein LCGC14_1192130 [marine sediment metagenome]|uniref:Uncharacterized protein n=1 Tax=marine sediment metagenome TaxID=412755 RepID=A0A0F9LNW0_9ZZZZ